MIVAPTTAPAPTPAPALPSAHGLIDLKPRQTVDFDFTADLDLDCINIYAGLQCTSILSGCWSDFLEATNINAAATECYCDYGISYLDCFFSEVATGTCSDYFGTEGFGEYQRSYFSDYCGTIPPSAMAFIQPPTSVSLDFETFDVVTATGALQQPNYNGQPNYLGSGQLLEGPCSQTDFTLVDASSTIYYAGFQGCVKDRPECCPWAVDMAATDAPPSAGEGNAQDTYDFPQPVDQDMAVLARCADDYYSISGGCCPNGFWPFTSKVGGITPCWSSVESSIDPPTLTVEKDGTVKDKPTSAVVNIIWSMRYPVAEPGGGGLSTAAKAGIGAGAGVAAILIAGLAICLWRQRRKNKKLAETQPGNPPPEAQTQQQLQMTQQSAAPNGQYPPGAYGNMPPPSDRASIGTNGTPISPLALAPQNTGTSNGRISELSTSQSDQQLLHNNNGQAAAAMAANPHRVSYSSTSNGSLGTGSPAVGPNSGGGLGGYPAPIAEADEGRLTQQMQMQMHSPPPQGYGYQQYPPQQQQQQQQQQYYYYVPPGQHMPQQQQQMHMPMPMQMQMQMPAQGQGQGYYPLQGGYAYPQQQQPQQPQQQGYSQNVAEVSAGREVGPPQEVMGSGVAEDGKPGAGP